MTDRPVIVLGAGGHAKVVIGALKASGVAVLGATDPDEGTHGKSILGVTVLGGDDKVSEHQPDEIALVNGVGSMRVSGDRKEIFDRFTEGGFVFAVLLHPSAVIGQETGVADGAQVMAGAVIQPGCSIGANAIINTGAQVDHDCTIGDHVHIAPGAVLGGGVTIEDGAFIGAGATVIQNIEIGKGALVAAGATVISNVSAARHVAGTPARGMKNA